MKERAESGAQHGGPARGGGRVAQPGLEAQTQVGGNGWSAMVVGAEEDSALAHCKCTVEDGEADEVAEAMATLLGRDGDPAELGRWGVRIMGVQLELSGGDRSLAMHDEVAVRENDRCAGAEVGRGARVVPGTQFAVGGQELSPGVDVAWRLRSQRVAGWHDQRWQAVEIVTHVQLRHAPATAELRDEPVKHGFV